MSNDSEGAEAEGGLSDSNHCSCRHGRQCECCVHRPGSVTVQLVAKEAVNATTSPPRSNVKGVGAPQVHSLAASLVCAIVLP